MKPRLNQRIQFSLAYVLVAAMVLLLVQSWLQAPRTVEIPMSRFLDLVRADKVEKVALTEREIRGIAKPDALPTGPSGAGDRLRQWLTSDAEVRVFTVTRIPGVDEAPLIAELERHKVEFTGRIESTFVRDLFFGWIIPLGVMIAIWMVLMRRGGGWGGGWGGGGGGRVGGVCERARERARCVMFIGEGGAIGKSRAGSSGFIGGHDEREQTLNQLLAEMDGFDSSKGVIIMAATNRPEVLDQALLRPGRFDRQVVVDKPDLRGREAILRLHARAVVLASGVDLGVIAARTPGFAGADLANIVNEAALLAARKEKNGVEMADFEEAIDRVVAGLEKKSRVLSEKERDIVAHHEMGHALVATSVAHADPVHKVTIIPRGIAALGMTYQLPTEERFLMTRSELEDRIAVLLGGRVAEELVYGEVSTGAHNDLERATEVARLMVTKYGMSERVGLATYGERTSLFLKGAGISGEREYSEATARTIDEGVRAILERTHDRVRGMLTTKKAVLISAAQALKRTETLEGEGLRRALAGESMMEGTR